MPNDSNELTTRDASSSSLALDDGGRVVAALECRIGRAQFAIPTQAIDRLIEYRRWPLPLAKGWVGGLGLHAGVPIISIALHRGKVAPASGATVKGILLTVPGSPVGWALEVDEVFVFLRATLSDRRRPDGGKLPRWIKIASSPDRRSLAFVDVAQMLADVAHIDIEPGVAGARS